MREMNKMEPRTKNKKWLKGIYIASTSQAKFAAKSFTSTISYSSPGPRRHGQNFTTQQLVPSESLSSIQSRRNRTSYRLTTTPRVRSASTQLYESLGFPGLKIDPFTISTLKVTQSLAEDEVGIFTSPDHFYHTSRWPRQLDVGSIFLNKFTLQGSGFESHLEHLFFFLFYFFFQLRSYERQEGRGIMSACSDFLSSFFFSF